MMRSIYNVLFLSLTVAFLAIPLFVSAQTTGHAAIISDLQKQIEALTRQVEVLQVQLAETQSAQSAAAPASGTADTASSTPMAQEPATTTPATIAQDTATTSPLLLTRSLSRGISGDDVRRLQEFLARDRDVYPSGLVTGFFGSLTEAALKKWQAKHGIDAAGVVGPKTIAKIQEIGKGVIAGILGRRARDTGIDPRGFPKTSGLRQIAVSTTGTTTTAMTPLGNGNIFVCHAPPGNVEARHTLEIGTSAWDAHRAHGDTLGACPALSTATSTAPSAISATPATPAQPVGQTGTTTVPAIPAQPAQISTSTTDTIPPSTPTNFTASATGYYSPVWLSWSKSTDNIGVVGYKLYKNGALLVSAATSSALTTLSYTDSNIAHGITYSYAVAAYDAAGNISAQATAAVTTPTVQAQTTCSGLNLTFQNNKTSYVIGETVTYTYTCTPGGSASYVEIQVLKPDGIATKYNSASSISTATLGFGTSNLVAGNYTLRACFTVGCSSVIASLPFTITTSAVAPPAADTAPPVISNIQATASSTSATITWTTDELSDSNVEYGQTSAYGLPNAFYSALVTAHSVSVSELQAATAYHYRVKSKDAAGNLATSGDQTLTTAAAAQVSAPTADIKAYDQVQNLQPSDGPLTAAYGTTVFIAWTSQNATSCTASGNWPNFSGTKSLQGTEGTAPNNAGTYTATVTCANGNTQASDSISITVTAATPLPAPIAGDTGTSHLGAVFGAGGIAPSYSGSYNIGVRFRYDAPSVSSVQSFRVYHKKPGDAAFSVAATFANPSSLVGSGSSIRYGAFGAPGSWILTYVNSSLGAFWEAKTNNTSSLEASSNFPVGEYQSYVVAVDSSGTESPPSATMRHIVLDRTTILSPSGAQTSANPTFSWTVASGWPTSPSYYLRIYDASVMPWSKSVSVNTSAGTGSKVYDGPALDPSKTYTVFIDAPGMYSGDTPYTSMNAGTQTFSISSATTTAAAPRAPTVQDLAAILRSLAATLETLRQTLR